MENVPEEERAAWVVWSAAEALRRVLGVDYGEIRIPFRAGAPTGVVEVSYTLKLDVERMQELTKRMSGEESDGR